MGVLGPRHSPSGDQDSTAAAARERRRADRDLPDEAGNEQSKKEARNSPGLRILRARFGRIVSQQGAGLNSYNYYTLL